VEAMQSFQKQPIERAERFTSHALVEVKKFRVWPFNIHSAILLDLSTTGFKLEFTGEYRPVPGRDYWIQIPLSPLGILAPKRLLCKGQCRWFDASKKRMGGMFTSITAQEKLIIEQVVETLRRKGRGLD